MRMFSAFDESHLIPGRSLASMSLVRTGESDMVRAITSSWKCSVSNEG
jgi:hypothetical protein